MNSLPKYPAYLFTQVSAGFQFDAAEVNPMSIILKLVCCERFNRIQTREQRDVDVGTVNVPLRKYVAGQSCFNFEYIRPS